MSYLMSQPDISISLDDIEFGSGLLGDYDYYYDYYDDFDNLGSVFAKNLEQHEKGKTHTNSKYICILIGITYLLLKHSSFHFTDEYEINDLGAKMDLYFEGEETQNKNLSDPYYNLLHQYYDELSYFAGDE